MKCLVRTLLVLLLFNLLGFFSLSSGSPSSSTDDVSYNTPFKTLAKMKQILASQTAMINEIQDLAHYFDAVENMLRREEEVQSLEEEMLQSNVSAACFNNTKQIFEGLIRGESWAYKMLDSAGKPPSGLLEGNLYWLGSYDQCWTIHASSTNDTTLDFNGQYCKLDIGRPGKKSPFGVSTAVSVTYGVCLPDTCSGKDAKAMLSTLLAVVTRSQHFPVKNHTVQVFSSECKVQFRQLEWTAGAIASLSVLTVITTCLLIGTVYDILFQHTNILKKHDTAVTTQHRETDGSTVENGETISASTVSLEVPNNEVRDNRALLDTVHNQLPPKTGVFHNILVAFSAYSNGAKLLSTAQGEGSLRAVHGIRFISMSWVILGHTLFCLITSKTWGNIVSEFPLLEDRWTTQAIIHSTMSVDTFFVLSGALLSYLFMKEMAKIGGPKKVNWFMFYFHRYWRLTPPYMLVLLTYANLQFYWSEGPQYVQYDLESNCGKNWWTNILYINNFFNTDQQCMDWSWYLANDMQFFVISPLILVALYYNWIIGSAVITALLLMNLIATGVISTQNHVQATFEDQLRMSDSIYTKPWCRIGPYVIGIALGYILNLKKCKVTMHWAVNLIGWCVAIVIGILVVYGTFDQVLPQGVSSLYIATSKSAWGLAVCWVIFACVTGNGGFINTFLSWKGFIPLSRLTFCAYLVHPVIMNTYYTSLRTPYIATDLTLIYSFFGHLVAAYLIAFVTSLLFESPMIGLEKALFRKH